MNRLDPELFVPDVRYLASVANPEDERECPAQFRSVIQTAICLEMSTINFSAIVLQSASFRNFGDLCSNRFAEEDTKDLTCEGIRQAILREIKKYRAKDRAAAASASAMNMS